MGVDARGARSRATKDASSRREASDVVHRASVVVATRASSSSSRARRRARAATDRTTHSRAAPTRATKVVMFYHG